MTNDVIVVGGGLGGALTARALHLAGIDVTVVDAASRPGGVAVPVRRQGYLLEPAAGTIALPNPHLGRLLDGLDLAVAPAGPASGRRLVRHDGVVHQLGPGVLSTRLVSLRGKVRAAAELFVPRAEKGDESLSAFMRRRFGTEVGRLAAWLAAAGVHAGDPDRLSVGAAFPTLAALEASHGSVLRGMLARPRAGSRARRGDRPSPHLVEGGTATVAAAVASSLAGHWRSDFVVGRIHPHGRGWRVDGPDQLTAERVVVAVAPSDAAPLFDDAIAELLTETGTAPVAVVWLGLVTPELPDAIGMLIGPDEGFDTLGFLFESSYAPARSPTGRGLVKAIVGGACRPKAVELTDAELVGRVTTELASVLGSDPEVEMSHVVRHRPGIPQYTSRRRHMLARLARALPTGLSVAGWGYDGVGLTQLATAATSLAERLAWEATTSLDTTP